MHGAIRAITALVNTAPPVGKARLGVLLLILATLLIFVFGLLVILAVRRSLRPPTGSRKKPRPPATPAWSEAGRRATPIPPAPEAPNLDDEATP